MTVHAVSDMARSRINAAQVAADYLRETGNPAVGWGDSGLLHRIAERLGLSAEGPKTERRVLARIERSYQGILVKRHVRWPGRGLYRVREFWLPENEAELNKNS